MNILHIASISNDKTLGVNVVVPEHILAESKYENVFFYNVKGFEVPELKEMQIVLPSTDDVIGDLCEKIGKIDIVIIHEVNYIEYIKIYKALLRRNIPYVILPHGEITDVALHHHYLKKKVAYILLFNAFLRHAKAIQCLSQGEMKNIRIKGLDKFVVGNGVDLPSKSKDSFSTDGLRVLYIGRLDVRHKGIDLLVEAIAKMKDILDKNNVHLDMYGPDIKGRGDEIRALIENNEVSKYITLHGPIYKEDKERAYLDSDIFLQTSRHEGLPTSILEAMSYGLPCVATKGTNMTDLINSYDAGYDAGEDVNSIVSALTAAISDSENYASKSSNARRAIEENYLWDKIAKVELEKYRELIK